MFLTKSESKLNALLKDPICILLFLNALFVIIGYAITNLTNGAFTGDFSIFKNIFLIGSFGYLFLTNRIVNPRHIFDAGFVPIIFGLLILYISIGTGTDLDGFYRTITFLVPMTYIYLSLSYLIPKFGVKVFCKGLHLGILIIFSIPLIFYIFSGGKITDTNIYGPGGDEQAFGSNNYGWSATLYILSYLFVWKDISLKKYYKIFFSLLLLVAVILFFTSANRASWLSMSISVIPFFFTFEAVKIKYKITGLLIVVGFIAFLLADPNSSINYAINKTKEQEQIGESRFQTANIMFDQLSKDQILWITGTGMFNFAIISGKTHLSSYHNSYYEVLFGAGIILYFLFLTFMVLRPLIRYLKYYSKYTFLLPPLMIIPFFESNLTAGQFLFFPWFTFMLLMNAKIKFWNSGNLKVSANHTGILQSDTANQ